MKSILSKYKTLAMLFFLFGYTNLYALGGSSACRAQEKYRQEVAAAHKLEICNQKSRTIAERLQDKHAFLYIKIPDLGNEYLEYANEDLEFNLEPDRRKEKTLPIYIEVGGNLLNPRKEDFTNYKVSSKIKEQIILENITITRRNCAFLALGSEYLFPVQSGPGTLSVILYFNYSQDVAMYYKFRSNTYLSQKVPENYFDQFIHRGLLTEVNFMPGKIYQIEIAINPNSAIPRKSYNATSIYVFERMETVPGFTIILKELPPNTKFAFDGKDDVGKTYEQVKKEFILYDKDADISK